MVNNRSTTEGRWETQGIHFCSEIFAVKFQGQTWASAGHCPSHFVTSLAMESICQFSLSTTPTHIHTHTHTYTHTHTHTDTENTMPSGGVWPKAKTQTALYIKSRLPLRRPDLKSPHWLFFLLLEIRSLFCVLSFFFLFLFLFYFPCTVVFWMDELYSRLKVSSSNSNKCSQNWTKLSETAKNIYTDIYSERKRKESQKSLSCSFKPDPGSEECVTFIH